MDGFSVESRSLCAELPHVFQSCECERVLCVRSFADFVLSERGGTRFGGGEKPAEASSRRNGGKEDAAKVENG